MTTSTEPYVEADSRYMRAVSLFGFREMVASPGHDAGVIFAEAGIEVGVLDDPDAFISASKYGTLLEIAAHILQRPNCGLEWAKQMAPHFANLGPVMFAALKAKTIGEWTEHIEAYWHSHTNAYRPRRIRLQGPYIDRSGYSWGFRGRCDFIHVYDGKI